MAEATPASAPTESRPEPKQVCEKCRILYPLAQFEHGVGGQECVCRRCLAVMGYQVK